jgi:tetratricopeptide (TPR) repeat protein
MVGKLYFMTDRPNVLETPDDDHNQAIHLIYAHGSAHRYLLLNSEPEIEENANNNCIKLRPYFERHGVIVLGYGGWNDAIMRALGVCDGFDHNLYWCDRHDVDQLPAFLNPKAMELLRRRRGNAFYVRIDGADQAIRELHKGLGLGDLPASILSPLDGVMRSLRHVVVADSPRSSTAQGPTDTFKDVLDRTLTRLEAAKAAFDQPEIQGETHRPGQEQARIAKLMNDAYMAVLGGRDEAAIQAWSQVIESPAADAEQKGNALLNRGFAYGRAGQAEKETADYTAVAAIPDVPSELKAWALVNRGGRYAKTGKANEGIADCDAVLAMPNAPAEQKAKALLNRGVMHRQTGQVDKAIADYDAVLAMPNAPAETKANALVNRGVAYGQTGKPDKAIADYDAVLAMPDTTAETKAKAIFNRGAVYGRAGKPDKAIADYDAVLAMPDAPAEQKAGALVNRGAVYGRAGKPDKAIADYDAVLAMSDAPAEQKANALCNRGWDRYKGGDLAGFAADTEEALKLAPRNRVARFSLGLARLLQRRPDEATAEYAAAAAACTDAAQVEEDGIADLEAAIAKRGHIDGAEAILALLRQRAAELRKP